jgi:hypothetical protein
MSSPAPEPQPGAAPEPPAAVFQAPPEPPPAPEAPPQAAADPAPDPEAGEEPRRRVPPTNKELPDWAQKIVSKARDEAAEWRVKAQTAADEAETRHQTMLDGIAKALGLKPEEVTPEQLAAERDAAKASAEQAATRARQSDVRLAVLQQAFAAQADGNALLDSVGFLRTVDALDPTASDFGDRVKDAIAAAVEINPRYKIDAGPPAPPPRPQPQIPASGPGQGFTSPAPGPRQWTDEDVARASPSQLTEALDAGLLENLGFGQRRASRR